MHLCLISDLIQIFILPRVGSPGGGPPVCFVGWYFIMECYQSTVQQLCPNLEQAVKIAKAAYWLNDASDRYASYKTKGQLKSLSNELKELSIELSKNGQIRQTKTH